MALLSSMSGGEVLTRVAALEAARNVLKQRWDDDYDRWRQEPVFKIPAKEGQWDSYHSNRAASEANRIIYSLSGAERYLWIPSEDVNLPRKRKFTDAEKLVIGILDRRDRQLLSVPEAIPLQDMMVWCATVRGWLCLMVYLGDEGATHINAYDPYNSFWISDDRGVAWFAHRRHATIDEIKAAYPEFVSENAEAVSAVVDAKKRIFVYQVSDHEEMGVVVAGKWARKPERHGLDHNPVLILPVGSSPLVQGNNDDGIKHIGESWAINNRHAYDAEHRLMSYVMTIVGRMAKTPMVIEYDGDGSDGLPIELKSSPFEKGTVVYLDKSKGQAYKEGPKPEMTADIWRSVEKVMGDLSIGGQGPAAFGAVNQALPAAGINLLAELSLANIKPIKTAVERAFAWAAEELLLQFKNGDFGKTSITGYDNAGRYFSSSISSKDVSEARFQCELNPNLPYDMQVLMSVASQAVEAGIWSRDTAREKSKTVRDLEKEADKIALEHGAELTFTNLRRYRAALLREKDFEGVAWVDQEMAMRRLAMMQGMKQPGLASQPGAPSMPPNAIIQGRIGGQAAQRQGLGEWLRSRFGRGG